MNVYIYIYPALSQVAASGVTRLPAPVRRNAIADDGLLTGKDAFDTGPEMCSGYEAGSYLRRIDFCISQL